MNQLVRLDTSTLPQLVTAAGDKAEIRFLEFFASQIRNTHTRRAYSRAVCEFLTWCYDGGIPAIAPVRPLHVATCIEMQTRSELAAPTVMQQLAAIRHLLDWLVKGQVLTANPAGSVRGPTHIVRTGKTPVLDPPEARLLFDSIDVSTPVGLRDRALIGTLLYAFARIGAAVGMHVDDASVQRRRLWVRLHEKGGNSMKCRAIIILRRI